MTYILTPDPKQITAMADYLIDAAKQRTDAAIDAEEERDNLIAMRADEIEASLLRICNGADLIDGLNSIMTLDRGVAIGIAFRSGNMERLGQLVDGLIRESIRQDAEYEATRWVERIEREIDCVEKQL